MESANNTSAFQATGDESLLPYTAPITFLKNLLGWVLFVCCFLFFFWCLALTTRIRKWIRANFQPRQEAARPPFSDREIYKYHCLSWTTLTILGLAAGLFCRLRYAEDHDILSKIDYYGTMNLTNKLITQRSERSGGSTTLYSVADLEVSWPRCDSIEVRQCRKTICHSKYCRESAIKSAQDISRECLYEQLSVLLLNKGDGATPALLLYGDSDACDPYWSIPSATQAIRFKYVGLGLVVASALSLVVLVAYTRCCKKDIICRRHVLVRLQGGVTSERD